MEKTTETNETIYLINHLESCSPVLLTKSLQSVREYLFVDINDYVYEEQRLYGKRNSFNDCFKSFEKKYTVYKVKFDEFYEFYKNDIDIDNCLNCSDIFTEDQIYFGTLDTKGLKKEDFQNVVKTNSDSNSHRYYIKTTSDKTEKDFESLEATKVNKLLTTSEGDIFYVATISSEEVLEKITPLCTGGGPEKEVKVYANIT